MSINDYSEKSIRNAIKNKLKPAIQKSRSKHDKGKIYLQGKIEARVKIPNAHNKIMKESKSKYIANGLKLNHDEFNELIDCPLTGPMYYKKLEAIVKRQKKATSP